MDVGSIHAAGTGPMGSGPDSLRQLLHDPTTSEAVKAKEAGRQFEATLLRTFLNEAMKPVFEGGALKEGGSANSIYRQHLIDAMADNISQGQSLGFSNLVQQQLHPQSAVAERPGGER